MFVCHSQECEKLLGATRVISGLPRRFDCLLDLSQTYLLAFNVLLVQSLEPWIYISLLESGAYACIWSTAKEIRSSQACHRSFVWSQACSALWLEIRTRLLRLCRRPRSFGSPDIWGLPYLNENEISSVVVLGERALRETILRCLLRPTVVVFFSGLSREL